MILSRPIAVVTIIDNFEHKIRRSRDSLGIAIQSGHVKNFHTTIIDTYGEGLRKKQKVVLVACLFRSQLLNILITIEKMKIE